MFVIPFVIWLSTSHQVGNDGVDVENTGARGRYRRRRSVSHSAKRRKRRHSNSNYKRKRKKGKKRNRRLSSISPRKEQEVLHQFAKAVVHATKGKSSNSSRDSSRDSSSDSSSYTSNDNQQYQSLWVI